MLHTRLIFENLLGSQQTSTNDAFRGGWRCHAVTGHEGQSRLSNRERRFGDSPGHFRPFHAGIGTALLIAREGLQIPFARKQVPGGIVPSLYPC